MTPREGDAVPDRIAFDANGYGWRVWDGEDYWSMIPTNPDNEPIPEPVTWFVRLPTPQELARIQWDAEGHAQRGVPQRFDDLPVSVQTPRLRWAAKVLAILFNAPAEDR